MLAHGLSTPSLAARLGLATLITVGLVSASCERVPLLAPSNTLLELTASSSTLAVNGSVEITAMLTEGLSGGDRGGGSPVQNGTLVTFSTNLGRLEPAEAKTTNGRATVRLVADGRSGTAVVKAVSGGAANADNVTASLEVPIGAAAAARIAVTASPQALAATGGTATIAARVEDQQGNGLPGVPVSFSTTRGTLSATTALSNDQGIASTSLTTTLEATVTASAGGATASLSGTVLVTIKPRAVVTISAPATATVGVPAAFTLTPTANAVLTNVTVDFGDGTGAELGSVVAATNISHPFRFSGISTVTVSARDSEGTVGTTSTQVAVSPMTVTLVVSPSSTTQPQVGTIVTFTATATTGAIVDRYEWTFGDGNIATTTGNITTYAYGSAGTRVASVRAVPLGNGTAAVAVATVDVKP